MSCDETRSSGFFLFLFLWFATAEGEWRRCSWSRHLDSICCLRRCCRSVTVASPAKLLQRYWMACQFIGCPTQSASKLSVDSAGFNSLGPVVFSWAPCKSSTFQTWLLADIDSARHVTQTYNKKLLHGNATQIVIKVVIYVIFIRTYPGSNRCLSNHF